jgi:nucleoside-diphosphate-sugar epimerase
VEEPANTRILNKRILVSRNEPVAFVVGVSGFIGSHLAEKLLDKGIQVIGVDNLSSGNKSNLHDCVKNGNFHFLNEDISDTQTVKKLLNLILPRIDYAFFVAENGKTNAVYTHGVLNFLHFLKEARERIAEENDSQISEEKPKILFCSSIDLYDSKIARDRKDLKEAEVKFAKFVRYYKMNARVVRLAAVYGPRMHFRENDPMVRLLQVSLKGDLQKEQIDNDFSSRAVYIDDAVALLIKAILSGGTSHKIFDGSLLQPIKIAEVKQVLLDPLWHEERAFKPSELPPWASPNIEKTMTELGWRPKTSFVSSLRETVAYFKHHTEDVPESPMSKFQEEGKKWSFSNPEIFGQQSSVVSTEVHKSDQSRSDDRQNIDNERVKSVRWERFKQSLAVMVLTGILVMGLVYPVGSLAVGGVLMRNHLISTQKALEEGDFDKAKSEIAQVRSTINEGSDILKSVVILKRIGFLNQPLESANEIVNVMDEAVDGVNHAIVGSEALFQTTKIISGEDRSDPKPLYAKAQSELVAASEKISKVSARLEDQNFLNKFPVFLKNRILDLQSRIVLYQQLVDQARVASVLLPEITAVDGKKSYLVLLQNNLELRPAGGFIGSYGKFDFESGRLTGIKVDDIYSLDGQLKDIIEPPAEIKTHLNVNRWYLRDSNYDPDFPTSAKQASFFYKKEGGDLINGVVALDLTASGKLLNAVGGLDLPEYGETVDGDNLFERAITHAEVGFFPGSQAKKNYLVSLQTQLFNKVFYLSKQNWPAIIQAIGASLEQKHLMVYMEDPRIFSYLASQNWAGIMPRGGAKVEGETSDFLAVNEANLGANKANFYLKRAFNLETDFDKDGGVKHTLRVSYNNTSPSDVFPAGTYKNFFRVYMPLGSKLNKAAIGESDVTSQMAPFSDYGRTGYSIFFEVAPQETKNVVLEYSLPTGLAFKGEQVNYRLDVLKQAGTAADPFNWVLNYPINFQISDVTEQAVTETQQLKISTDLLEDRSFELKVKQK